MVPESLERARYLNLATFRRSGAAVLTPIWFAVEGGCLVAFSAGDAGKVKRLRHSPHARIAACGPRGGLRGPWIEARAHVVRDPAQIDRAYRALRAKYGWALSVADGLSRLTGRYSRRAVLQIEIEGGEPEIAQPPRSSAVAAPTDVSPLHASSRSTSSR